MKGTVVRFMVREGWGFVRGTDSREYFVHFSDVLGDDDYKILRKNECVTFDPAENIKGLKAVNVRLIIGEIGNAEVDYVKKT